MANSWSCFSIGVYGSKTVFSLYFVKCFSKQQARKRFLLAHRSPIWPIFSTQKYLSRGRAGKPLSSHRLQCNLGPAFPVFTSVARREYPRWFWNPHIPYRRKILGFFIFFVRVKESDNSRHMTIENEKKRKLFLSYLINLFSNVDSSILVHLCLFSRT